MPAASNTLFHILNRIPESIVFYPVVITSSYALLAVAVLLFEASSLASSIRELLPLGLTDPDNGREILGTLLTSIVSLMVFSFSMVMVVLNGAADRLTPRVLPGLISDTRNRVILGIYLGSALYYLLLISTITNKEPSSVPAIGLLLALVMGVASLALFVMFIRSVSQSIQVDWILRQLSKGAHANLEKRKNRLALVASVPDDDDWWCLPTMRAGYLREVNERQLGELLSKRNLFAVIQVEPGFFLVQGHPLIRFSEPLNEKDQALASDCFDFHSAELASSNVSYGMRQMTEIAVKAISPAVNDPGTAIRAINLISVLLQRIGGVPAFDVGCFEGQPRLFYPQLAMSQILELVIAPIRVYGSHDPLVMITLFQCMKNALHDSPSEEQIRAIHEEASALRDQADAQIKSWRDRQAVNDALERLLKLDGPKRPSFAPLPINKPTN
ncbi:DUF2254 domain-containing protein [Stutzerimonas stutzeri]|uniref:DUF2254 domain-containing protein n=1 Tax=Stutzerimonas stutzeri TaxID=316 RepID=UPI00210F1EB4|nr:DUF2254 domain-containing protein [Stutzerimonas stutzeri]MCQ4258159.1 DUF2254 domain-containing protein [Stutzerimonas stutzeri]